MYCPTEPRVDLGRKTWHFLLTTIKGPRFPFVLQVIENINKGSSAFTKETHPPIYILYIDTPNQQAPIRSKQPFRPTDLSETRTSIKSDNH